MGTAETTGAIARRSYTACCATRKGVRSPFIALTGVINAAMWQIATLGVAIEMLTDRKSVV